MNSRYLKAFITFQSRLSLRQTPFGSAVIGHLESFPSAREFNKMIEELNTVRTNLQDLGRGVGWVQKVMSRFVLYCRHERPCLCMSRC